MISLRILGPMELRAADGAELRSLLAQPKRTALLAYLAAEAPRGFQRRDTLLGLFWPEFDESRARAALSRALHFLRQGLGDSALRSRGDDELTVDQAHLWCDVAAFDAARAAGDHAGALALYRGDLLEGFLLEEVPEFERWVERERRRLRLAAGASAAAVAEARARDGDLAGAVDAARRGADIDSHDEVALRRLVTLLERSGDRAGAIAAYDAAARRLRAELDVEPSAESRALMEAVRARASSSARPTSVARLSVAPQSVAPPVAISAERELSAARATVAESPEVATPAATPTSASAVAAPPSEITALPSAERRGRRRWIWLAGIAAALVVAVTMTLWWRALGGGRRGAAHDRVIAVLPFADLSAGHDQAYFSDGLADELIASLGTIRGLDVVARTSSFALRGKELPADEIGRRLHASHVLEGSVRREDDRLRITVQLIDAATGYRVWSKAFDARARDVLAVQGQISREVADAVQPQLDVAARPATPRPVAPEVYDLYLKGRYIYLGSDPWEETANASAAEAFRQAIARDSGYAPAWAGLADVLAQSMKPDSARLAAERALALDSTLADGHAALAYLLAYYGYQWDAALREMDRAVVLAPASAPALLRRAEMRSVVGRHAEAMGDADRAYRLDPLSPAMAERRAWVYMAADRWSEAVTMYRTILDAQPDLRSAHEGLARALLGAGRNREAAAEFLATYHDTVSAAIALRDRPLMQRLLKSGEEHPGLRHPAAMASLYAYLGRMDDAFAQLERARLQLKGQPAVADVPHDPRLMIMRSDPRFPAVAARWIAP